jgi:hypothetical protein
MGRHRITLDRLRRILRTFEVQEDASRGKGSHTFFHRIVDGRRLGYPIPTQRDVNPVYVKGVRRALQIDADDDEFFGRA